MRSKPRWQGEHGLGRRRRMALVIVTTSQMMIDHTETRNGDASTISTQAMYRADAWPTQPEQDELEENQRCGGLAHSAQTLGYSREALVENNPRCVSTLKTNGFTNVHCSSICDMDFTRFRGVELLALALRMRGCTHRPLASPLLKTRGWVCRRHKRR